MKRRILIPVLLAASSVFATTPNELLQLNETIYSISAEGTEVNRNVAKNNMLPRGSALITESGDLQYQSINYIIHIASGSMTMSGKEFDPTLDGIKMGIKNGLTLAKENDIQSVALPVIGGRIFLHRIGISEADLAKEILLSLSETQPEIIKSIVIYKNPNQLELFKSVHQELGLSDNIKIVMGDITKYADHKSEAIMNAANMEVQFGGGVSGVIARAVGQRGASDIDSENFSDIVLFNNMIAHRVEKLREIYSPLYEKEMLNEIKKLEQANAKINRELTLALKQSSYENQHQQNLQKMYDDLFFLAKINYHVRKTHADLIVRSNGRKAKIQKKIRRSEQLLNNNKKEIKTIQAEYMRKLETKLNEEVSKMTITGSQEGL